MLSTGASKDFPSESSHVFETTISLVGGIIGVHGFWALFVIVKPSAIVPSYDTLYQVSSILIYPLFSLVSFTEYL